MGEKFYIDKVESIIQDYSHDTAVRVLDANSGIPKKEVKIACTEAPIVFSKDNEAQLVGKRILTTPPCCSCFEETRTKLQRCLVK